MENSSTSSTSFDPNNLNNLPDLVYHYVFRNLDLDDLWDLRLISKRFYGIVKSHKIYELTLGYHKGNWFSTIKSHKPGNQLRFSKPRLLLNPTDNLLNLKYLSIFHLPLPIRIDDLNKFTQLQVLEVGEIKLGLNSLLQLPDLIALGLGISSYGLEEKGTNLVIDTPNLHSLAIQHSNFSDLIDKVIKFNHPQSVKHLRLYRYDQNTPIFTNLEFLEILEIHANIRSRLKTEDLLKFDNLKKLRFNHNIYLFKIKRLTVNETDSVANWLKVLFRSKDLFRLKKNDLEFVLWGVKIKEINKIDEWKMKSALGFQLDNYGELEDDLHFVNDVNYNQLVHLLPTNQPADLFTKYNNIKALYINSRIEDDNRLIHFIKSCSNLEMLDIGRSSLNQQFYDQLPAISSLNRLRVHNEGDLGLNFEFIMKMPYLCDFRTDQDVLISKQLNLNDCKRLLMFEIKIKNKNRNKNNKKLNIQKNGRDRYRFHGFKSLNMPKLGYMDHDKLIEWCNWLRNNVEREARSSAKRRRFM